MEPSIRVRFSIDPQFKNIYNVCVEIRTDKSKKLVMVSGGFDPIHVGHLQMFEEAKALGDELVVVINCDAWLSRKKGKPFMSSEDRAKIIHAFECVDHIYVLESDRHDVGEALELIRPDIFANGGDRFADNIPELQICQELGIEMVFNVGKDGKLRSSSELLKNYHTI